MYSLFVTRFLTIINLCIIFALQAVIILIIMSCFNVIERLFSMKIIKVQIVIISALIGSVLFTVVANAEPVTYTYTGNNFTQIFDAIEIPGSFSTSNHIQITLTTINGYLTDSSDMVFVDDQLSIIEISDGRNMITKNTADYLRVRAIISNGLIEEWTIDLVQYDTINELELIMESNSYYNEFVEEYLEYDSTAIYGVDANGEYFGDSGENNENSGTWVRSIEPISGDITGDGDVDGEDLFRLVSQFDVVGCGGCPEDLNEDDNVNEEDVVIFAQKYGAIQ